MAKQDGQVSSGIAVLVGGALIGLFGAPAASLRTTIHDKHTALQTLLTNGSTDANAIGKAMIEIRDLQKQITAAQSKIQEQALSFLTADQKSKLKALEDAEKLRPAIGQAHALHLLAPPANAGPGGMFR